MRISIDTTTSQKLPLFSAVRAWYPFPAVDITHKEIDINHFLVPHPASTFLLRVKDDLMLEQGIVAGDYIIVDREVREMKSDDIVVVAEREGTAQFILVLVGDKREFWESRELLGKVVWVFRRMR